MDALLDTACNWLAARPWLTRALVVASILVVAAMDRVP